MFPMQRAQFIAQCKVYQELNEQLTRQLWEQERLNQQGIVPVFNFSRQDQEPQIFRNVFFQPILLPSGDIELSQVSVTVISNRPVGVPQSESPPPLVPVLPRRIAPRSIQIVEISSDESDEEEHEQVVQDGSDTDSDKLVIDTDYESDNGIEEESVKPDCIL